MQDSFLPFMTEVNVFVERLRSIFTRFDFLDAANIVRLVAVFLSGRKLNRATGNLTPRRYRRDGFRSSLRFSVLIVSEKNLRRKKLI